MPDPDALRFRRARSFDLNEVADLRADCRLVPSPRGFRNEMERDPSARIAGPLTRPCHPEDRYVARDGAARERGDTGSVRRG